MPQKSRSWSQLKETGNQYFKRGQYGEATDLYSRAIGDLETSSQKSPEDLAVLYCNRAASYLKNGNCSECVKDCSRSLQLCPFNIKSLLRRAAAHEALERYGPAYVDYKTALQVDCNIAAAHAGANRMTKALSEADGFSWREKLPPIPTVPLSVREGLRQPTGPLQPAQTNRGDLQSAQSLREEGNSLVKKGNHRTAVDKYSQSLRLDPTEASTYTNRALCFLTLKEFDNAVSDCGDALKIDRNNVKALYRRAQANRELKNVSSCVNDLELLLSVEPKNSAATKLLHEVQK